MGAKQTQLERADAIKEKSNKKELKSKKDKVDSNLPPSVYGEICVRRRARRKRQKVLVIELLLDYAKNSTLHGLRYLSERGLSNLEKIFWLVTFLASVAMCSYLISNVYKKWQTSPVIVSFNEHIVPVENVPFPSVTICPQSKIDTKVYNFSKEYERSRNKSTEIPRSEAETMQDVSLLCNWLNKKIDWSRDRTNSSLVENILKVAPNFTDTFYFCIWRGKPINCENMFKRVLTREGVCYNFNSLAAEEIFKTQNIQNDYEYIQNTSARMKNWTLLGGYEVYDEDAYPYRGRDNGASPDLEVFLTDSTESKDALCNRWARGFKIFVQNPLDMPQSTLYYYAALPKQVSSLALKFSMLTTTESLKDYSSNVRQCYFPSNRPLRYFKVYTQNNCRLECLANYTFDKCECVAFYMPQRYSSRDLFSSTVKKGCKYIQQIRTRDVPTRLEKRSPLEYRSIIRASIWLGKANQILDDNSSHICTADQEDCVEDAANTLSNQDLQRGTDGLCQCFPDCHNIYYDAEILKTDFDFKNFLNNLVELRSHVPDAVEETLEFSKIEMYFKEPHFVSIRRSELFGITDFLSNIGGLLGLFLGFSFLSLVEIFYFLSLRLLYTLKRDLQEEKKNSFKSIT